MEIAGIDENKAAILRLCLSNNSISFLGNIRKRFSWSQTILFHNLNVYICLFHTRCSKLNLMREGKKKREVIFLTKNLKSDRL